MQLTKTTTVEEITVSRNGIVLFREVTCIIEDGKEISKTYNRTSLIPGQDLLGQPSNVAAIASLVWTPEVISAYQTAQQNVELANTGG